MTANVKILVILGAGEGSYEYDEPLAKLVRGQFGDPTQGACPRLDGLELLNQFDRNVTRKELDDGPVIGQSLEGAASATCD